jgi:hypothetical protein
MTTRSTELHGRTGFVHAVRARHRRSVRRGAAGGDVRRYGDQEWVACGDAVREQHPEGFVIARTIQVSYGPWRRIDVASTRCRRFTTVLTVTRFPAADRSACRTPRGRDDPPCCSAPVADTPHAVTGKW